MIKCEQVSLQIAVPRARMKWVCGFSRGNNRFMCFTTVESFTKCSKAVLWEVELAENMCSPSVDWDAQSSVKNCTFNQLFFRRRNFSLNGWQLEMIQFTVHCLKKSDALWEGKRKKPLVLKFANWKFVSLFHWKAKVIAQSELGGFRAERRSGVSVSVWKFAHDLGTFKFHTVWRYSAELSCSA